MVCKVRCGKSIKGALNYNEKKVKDGKAECIGAVNFVGESHHLTFHEKLARFQNLIELNTRAKTNTLHISLNFDVGEKLSQNKLNQIATSYMDKIGFGGQPYLVYQHHDAAHPHIHIVTTNIQDDGKRIAIHNLGKNQSETARKEIEEKYGLLKAGSKENRVLDRCLNKGEYGKSETKRTIDNIVGEVMKCYKFSSWTEFNAVLRQYNVMADRGKEGMIMFKKNGLLYSILDAKGNNIGVPIKASALNCKPTLKNLEAHFHRGSALRQDDKERLTNIVDSFFRETNRHTRTNFCDYMTSQGINAMFRENKEGRVYGLTFIDNKNGVVFNGSDLGKRYSGQMIIQRLQVKCESLKTHEGENDLIQNNNIHHQQHEFQHHFEKQVSNDIARSFSDLMKPIKSDSDSIDPALKKKRKPKRGLHL